MAEDSDPRADIPEGEEKRKQEILDAHGWGDPAELEKKLLTLPSERKERYLNQLRNAFAHAAEVARSDTKEEQASLAFPEDTHINLETPVLNIIPADESTVMTMDIRDFPILLSMAEQRAARLNTRGNLTEYDRVGLAKQVEATVRGSLKHEYEHFSQIAGQVEGANDAENAKCGVRIRYHKGDAAFSVQPFITFNGEVPLVTLIEILAAPQYPSFYDKEDLGAIEARLKKEGIMKEAESILKGEDREAMYQRELDKEKAQTAQAS